MKQTLTLANNEYTYYLVQSPEEIELVKAHLRATPVFALDLETTGLRWFLGDRIAGIALYFPLSQTAFYLSFRHGGENLPLSVMADLVPLITKPGNKVLTWNGKFDAHFLQNEGFPILESGVQIIDVMIALHLLDENRYSRGLNYKLKDAARQFIDPNAGEGAEQLDEELKKRKLAKGLMCQLEPELVVKYACLDVILTWELNVKFQPYLEKWQLTDLYVTQCQFLLVLLRMEHTGLLVDRTLIQQKIEALRLVLSDLMTEMQKLTGNADFNPNSPAQVKAILGTSDAQKETLKKKAKTNKLADLILRYKMYAKEIGTFFEPYLYWSECDSRIHPSLHIIGTISGRLSSSDPNLQQIPRNAKDGDEGYEVKDVFVAPDGYVLAQFDYKALELRLAAHFALQQSMIDTFNADIDPHQVTADLVGITRQIAKSLNFGLLYGMGITKAAEFLKISESEARELVPAWNSLYPEFRQMHHRLVDTATLYRTPQGEIVHSAAEGFQYIRLMDGRCRRYNFPGGEESIYSCWNTLVQGTGAIVMRDALLRLHEAFPVTQDDVIPVLTVHDSFVCYIKASEVDRIVPVIMGLMRDDRFNPAMVVECEIGDSYGKVKKYHEPHTNIH